MKSIRYIYILAILIFMSGCATGRLSEEKRLAREVQQEEVIRTIESGNFEIRADRLFTRRSARLDLKPSHNYIIVNNNMARINLAYVGRSYSARAISGINVSGKIEEMKISPRNRGAQLITMRVKGANELFTLYVHITPSGYCSIDINNARLDRISYRGKLSTGL